jgi:hypothetical protein
MVLAARGPIRSRDPETSSAALAIAAAVVAFGVVSFLFDAVDFPHGPYILLSLAGLLAVILRPEPAIRPAPARPLPARTTLRGAAPRKATAGEPVVGAMAPSMHLVPAAGTQPEGER